MGATIMTGLWYGWRPATLAFLLTWDKAMTGDLDLHCCTFHEQGGRRDRECSGDYPDERDAPDNQCHFHANGGTGSCGFCEESADEDP